MRRCSVCSTTSSKNDPHPLRNNNRAIAIPMEQDPAKLLTSLLQEIYWKQPPIPATESRPDHMTPTNDRFVGLEKFKCQTIDAIGSRWNKAIVQAETRQELLERIEMLTGQIRTVNRLLLKQLKKRDKHLRQQRLQYRYLEEFLQQHLYSSDNPKLSSSSYDWTPKIIVNTIKYIFGERKRSEFAEEMSSFRKKLRLIGRRFSVNDCDDVSSSSDSNSNSNKIRRHSGNIRLNLDSENQSTSSASTSAAAAAGDQQQQVSKPTNQDLVGGDHTLDTFNTINDVDEYSFEQWHNAMRMVARLPGGIPPGFRKRLWLMLAECYIKHQRKIPDWKETLEKCFNDSQNPDDKQLGWQIVKDLHRTGCSLFDGDQQHNQLLLKQLLLAYARFNKSIGYCQGFNMLAAIILEVMEGNVVHSLKIMIYLIEHLLPEGYFANNLRGLSVDMVVFRDLMHLKLPRLAKHLDYLQQDSYDPNLGIHYEPPLINAFTMQWFLTLFSNCLAKPTVLRIWDLIFLEGNEILLRSGIVIWDSLSERIIAVKSADEFYSIMNVLTREIMEFDSTDSNKLIMAICNVAPFPFPHLTELRENYYYNCSPFNANILFGPQPRSRSPQSGDAGDVQSNWFEDQLLMINWWLNQNNGNNNPQPNRLIKAQSSSKSPIRSICSISGNSGLNFLETIIKQIQGVPGSSQSSGGAGGKGGAGSSTSAQNPSANVGSLDISMLKKQYLKLKQRQRQVQIILKEGFQNIDPSTMNSKVKKENVAGGHTVGKEKESVGSNDLISKLLSGKAPLFAKRKSRIEATLKQSIARARFAVGRNDSLAAAVAVAPANVYPPTVHKSNSMMEIGPGTSGGGGGGDGGQATVIDGKPTFDVVALQPGTSSMDIEQQQQQQQQQPGDQRQRSEMGTKRALKRSNSSSSSGSGSGSGSSGGSTSTELCDEILGIAHDDGDGDGDLRAAPNVEGEQFLQLPPPPPQPPSSSSGSLSRSMMDLHVADNAGMLRQVRMQLDNDDPNQTVADQSDDYDTISDDVFYSASSTDGDDANDDGDRASTRASQQLDETIQKFQEKISQMKID